MLGEATRPDLDLLDGGFQRSPAKEVIHELAVPQRLHRLGAEADPVVQPPDLLQKPFLHHPSDPAVDPGVDDLRRVVESDQDDVPGRARPFPLTLLLGNGSPGESKDLQRADRPAAIVGMDAVRGFGVDRFQFGPQ